MTKKFKPTLVEPVGINNYLGTSFRCFTKGDTLPFKFTFKNPDGSPIDVTGYQLWIYMSDKQAVPTTDPQTQNLVSVAIPITDAVNGVFSGTVTDTDTNTLPDGIAYAQAVYTNNAGESFIIDMAMLEVYPAVPFDVL